MVGDMSQTNTEARRALEDARRHSSNVRMSRIEAQSAAALARRIAFAQQILLAGVDGRAVKAQEPK